jgi:transposase-like protein
MPKYGTPRRFYSDNEKQRVIELAREVGTTKAARFLDMPLSTVSKWYIAAVKGDAENKTTPAAAPETSKTTEDLRATVDATRRELVVFNATADELKSELRNLKTAVELLTETLLDTAQAAAPLVIPTITPGDATC